VFERQLAMLLQSLFNSELIGNQIINMQWNVVTFNSAEGPLLTSDRPFVVSNGMVGPNGHWIVPISPTQCFVATNSTQVLRELQALSAEEFIFRMNHKMACQAQRFVYGLDDSHLPFVSERLGRKESATPGDAP
jgi:hypothetical protein